MNNQKKYWCFNCNSECKIKIIKENDDNDEEYQCTKCNSTFIEEISNEDNPKDFHIEQTQSNNPTNSININNLTNFNLSINNVNSINIANAPTNSNNENTNDEYGMNDTLLFLPSTVNYKIRGNNTIRNTNNIFNSSFNHIITEIVTSNNNNNIFISRNLITRNSPILSFLSNHNNDNQFENLLNIIMSFDSIHKGNPPASQRAIDNLKKIEIDENNIKNLNEEICNVCLEEYKIGQISNKLDCGHCFHDKCILQWLKMRNTCPVCRTELESNDPNYEKRKHSHRETLRNFHSNYGNNEDNNNGGEASA